MAMVSGEKALQELVKRAGELFARGSKAPAVEGLLCDPIPCCTVFGNRSCTTLVHSSRPDLQRDLAIASISSTVVDVPTMRRHDSTSTPTN
jgi:hypothetical protein